MYFLMDKERTERFGTPYYWNQNQHGYTPVSTSAGQFTQEEAEKMVREDYDHRTVMIDENLLKDNMK